LIPIPRIALVGRPNVGKSTLFNRLCGRRKAITDNRPGSTRDRNHAQVSWQNAAFELIDTGGLLLATEDPLLGPATEQARRAITDADRVIMVVDARAGLLPDDQAIARELRREGKQVVLAVNKTEGNASGLEEFAPLGFEPAVPISAEHGQGVGELLDAALAGLPRIEPPEEQPALRLALVGRPNVGKSSLLNRILGEDRAVVSPIAGTTRDSVDSLIERDGQRYLLVDTAGIRRARLLKDNVDQISVVQARKAIERCDVAVLVLDAAEGLKDMDATIGGYVQESGCGVVLAVNKWDVALERRMGTKTFGEEVGDRLKFLTFAPVVFASARTGRGVPSLLKAVRQAQASRYVRVTTGELNRVIRRAAEQYAPKAAKGGRPVRILYAAQVGVAPPTFAISLSHDVDLHFSYKRFLENKIREAFGFAGTPLILKVAVRKH
jgi:GTP-binding protein